LARCRRSRIRRPGRVRRSFAGRMTAPITSESVSTRAWGVHQMTLAAAKRRCTSSPGATSVSSRFSFMTTGVSACRAATSASTGCARSCRHSKKVIEVVARAVRSDRVDRVYLEVDTVGDAVLGGVAAGARDRPVRPGCVRRPGGLVVRAQSDGLLRAPRRRGGSGFSGPWVIVGRRWCRRRRASVRGASRGSAGCVGRVRGSGRGVPGWWRVRRG
jgi:hypothetical protein